LKPAGFNGRMEHCSIALKEKGLVCRRAHSRSANLASDSWQALNLCSIQLPTWLRISFIIRQLKKLTHIKKINQINKSEVFLRNFINGFIQLFSLIVLQLGFSLDVLPKEV